MTWRGGPAAHHRCQRWWRHHKILEAHPGPLCASLVGIRDRLLSRGWGRGNGGHKGEAAGETAPLPASCSAVERQKTHTTHCTGVYMGVCTCVYMYICTQCTCACMYVCAHARATHTCVYGCACVREERIPGTCISHPRFFFSPFLLFPVLIATPRFSFF